MEAVVGHVVATQSAGSAHYVRLLVLLIREAPHDMLAYTAKVTETKLINLLNTRGCWCCSSARPRTTCSRTTPPM
eukprot:690182-Prorocentrum_minimum.AAC.4